MRRVLVTGATGFVGSHLVDRLLARDVAVTALVRSPRRAAHLEARGVHLVAGDLSDITALAAACEGQDAAIHVAALTGAVNEAQYLETNRDGTRRLAEAAAGAGVGRLVYVSSGAAGGPAPRGHPLDGSEPARPVTMYGRSKLAGEVVVRESGVPWTILRPPAVYGPGDTENFLAVFRAARRLGVAPVFGDGSQELSLVHVIDLAEACALATEADAVLGGVYMVNHPEVVTARDVVVAIGRAAGRVPRVLPLPAWLTRTVLGVTGAVAALLRRKTILRLDKANEFHQPAWTGDPARFIAATGWHPTHDLASGMTDTAAWYRGAGLL